ncbi:MAG: MFS transporter [Deltaproteobacteria bacterium]|nr:MFS transporter [Deltaproteobacteria bacterium]
MSVAASTSRASSAPSSSADSRRWLALAVLCAAQFLVILDTSIVGIALPAIQADLGFDASGLQWIFNAYVVAFGGLLLLGGRLSDLFGPRKVFATGFGILTAASLLAGLAPSAEVLLVGRALQGIGAALIAPASLSLVMALFGSRPAELGRALGFWGAAAAAGGTAGVFLGGVVTEWLGWGWTFLVNVPLGLLVLVATFALIPRGARRPGSVDVLGATLVTLGIGLLVYAIVAVESSSLALPALVASLVLLVAFVMLQRHRREPLVPLAIFRAENLAAGNIITALLGAAWIPMWFFLNMVLQQVLGLGAFDSGLALLPMTLTIMILMVGATGRVIGRIGPKRALVAGLALLTLALVLFAHMPADASFVGHVLLPSLLAALGMSLAYVPSVIVSTAGARAEDGGLASGIVNTTYQIGSAVGLAAMVAISGDASTIAFQGAAVIALVATLVAALAVREPLAGR